VFALVCLLGLFAGSQATNTGEREELVQKYEKALDTASAGTVDTPVTRVVKLLKEMQAQVAKEMDEDKEIYKKVKCWCNNNEYEKKLAVEAAEKKIEELEGTIEQLTALSAELNNKLKELNDGLQKDTEELAEATALRKKQLAEFHGGEVDSIQAIENLKAAIVVLGKHHAGAFPQLNLLALTEEHTLRRAKKSDPESKDERAMDRFMEHHDFAEDKKQTQDVDAKTKAFLQQNKAFDSGAAVESKTAADGFTPKELEILRKAKKMVVAFVQSHNPSQPYAAASGEILGIMKQMKETMEGELSESQKEETERAGAFAELRAAKEEEIAAAEKQIEDKTAELADTDMKLADAKEDIVETKAALDEDQKFLVNLKTTCETVDKDAAIRKKARLDEIQAINETIEILTNDDARDAMNTTFNFLQMSEKTSGKAKARREASALLRKVALQTKDPMLSMLASKVELDAFTEVKKAIDDMIATLKTQQEDEVKKNDYCIVAIQENEMETSRKEDLQGDLGHAIEDLETELKQLKESIAQTKAEIADLQVNMQRANETRKTENLEYQRVVADQGATEEVLKKALDRLATFYDAELIQMKKQQPPGEAAHLKGAVKNSGSSGVMSMIEKLIYDCREITKESAAAEQEAQNQYEVFIADTNASIKEKSDAVVTMSARKAEAEKELTEKQEELEATMQELEELAKMNGDLHAECDFVMKNFNIRQKARAAEIESLQQAKQILSGAM
jgi:hypothetical protein